MALKFMELKETNINIGIEKPFSIIHTSDTHFTLADERENDRKLDLAEVRRKIFIPYPEDKLADLEGYAKETGLTIVHTGDFIDFVSEANLERAKEFIDNNDVLFIAGNHEFSLYVGEAFEDEAYRNQSLAHVQEFFKDDIRFNAHIINGVNFVGIDNSYYRFDAPQLEALKKEVEKGYPIILFMHDPLYEEELFKISFYEMHEERCCSLVGPTEECLALYKEKFRQPIERPDEITKETLEYIKNQPLIKAILAGHVHGDIEAKYTDTLPQYITGTNTIRKVNIF